MSMTDSQTAPKSDTVEAPVKAANNRNVAKRRKSRKAAKGKTARQVASQRNRKPSGRKFKLTPTELKEMRAKSRKGFPNPYRQRSTYGAIVAAFVGLGLNKPHSFDAIKEKVRERLGRESWSAFVNRKSRNSKTGKNADGRLEQSINVLRRVKDYGKPLAQLGARVERRGDKYQLTAR